MDDKYIEVFDGSSGPSLALTDGNGSGVELAGPHSGEWGEKINSFKLSKLAINDIVSNLSQESKVPTVDKIDEIPEIFIEPFAMAWNKCDARFSDRYAELLAYCDGIHKKLVLPSKPDIEQLRLSLSKKDRQIEKLEATNTELKARNDFLELREKQRCFPGYFGKSCDQKTIDQLRTSNTELAKFLEDEVLDELNCLENVILNSSWTRDQSMELVLVRAVTAKAKELIAKNGENC